MARQACVISVKKRQYVEPTMVLIDVQTVRGGRFGPTLHNAGGRGGRTIGTKRTILTEILGLTLALQVGPAAPHDVRAGRELLAESLPDLPRVQAVGRRPAAVECCPELAARRNLRLDIKTPPQGTSGFVPIAPLYQS